MNEKEIINLANKYFSKNKSNKNILIKGIGDDTAVLENEKQGFQLFTSDMLVEETHFLLDKISPYNLGWKSLAVNISDIASMGGTPTYATLSLAITNNKKITNRWLNGFYMGMSDCATKYKMNIVGGDTVSSKKSLIINIALLGNTIRPIYRNNSKDDYIITTTGNLGLSGAGLSILLKEDNLNISKSENYCLNKHFLPIPKIEQGLFFNKRVENLSMIDCSDGLYVSLKTLSESVNLGIDIYPENLVIENELEQVSKILKKAPLDFILYGGEDYELIVSLPEEDFKAIQIDYFDKFNYRLPIIGRFTHRHNQIKLKGQIIDDQSFQHFK